jgi:uncharacterized protein
LQKEQRRAAKGEIFSGEGRTLSIFLLTSISPCPYGLLSKQQAFREIGPQPGTELMAKPSRPYQIFAKPFGPACNLRCAYCYYIDKHGLYPGEESLRMPDDILEEFIVQHMEASPDPVVRFSWHGGEPTLLGLDYFQKVVRLQRKHRRMGRRIVNGIQTNGMLLDEKWCRFLAAEGFGVGISLDGPEHFHDAYRRSRSGEPTHHRVMRGYGLLREHRVPHDVLCVVHDRNVQHPVEVYRFFKQIQAPYISFLPLVEAGPEGRGAVSDRTVPSVQYGAFLCAVFDEWQTKDIGRVRIQMFEEAAATALGQDHALCIFKKTCGDVPVIEHNGDVFACDHYVDQDHRLGNMRDTRLADLIEDPRQTAFGRFKQEDLPRCCRECEFLPLCNGGCPKDRILHAPDGEPGLNYLCAGYKRFFAHCSPFLAQLSALRTRESTEAKRAAPPSRRVPGPPKTGRNDPCPCGSGRKYKKCCMGRGSTRGKIGSRSGSL